MKGAKVSSHAWPSVSAHDSYWNCSLMFLGWYGGQRWTWSHWKWWSAWKKGMKKKKKKIAFPMTLLSFYIALQKVSFTVCGWKWWSLSLRVHAVAFCYIHMFKVFNNSVVIPQPEAWVKALRKGCDHGLCVWYELCPQICWYLWALLPLYIFIYIYII